MRYRRLSYRYTTLTSSSAALGWPLVEAWPGDRLRLLMQGRWRPDADAYETARTVEIIVDLAGLGDDDFEVQLFEDALVVQGRRELPRAVEGVRYQAARILQGPFALALPLPAPVDAEGVTARYERGLLSITLPKRIGDP
jgi:HSP20 family molecular chaperone IbpA